MPSSGTVSTVPLLPVLALPASLPAPRLAAAPALGWWAEEARDRPPKRGAARGACALAWEPRCAALHDKW